MLSMLIAYNADGDVIATLDYMVARDGDGNATGLIDFEAHEAAGAALTDVWNVDGAVGSGTWPEWLGSRAHDFRVELDGPPARKRIRALSHRVSGQRRERHVIEARIAQRVTEARDGVADIRDLVGGPDRPLLLDDEGRTLARRPSVRPSLPVVSARAA